MGYLSDQDQNELKLYEILKQVIDPELGISIIDMGLVYNIRYSEDEIDVTMTLSSRACPMGELITNNIREVVKEQFPDAHLNINLVWEPAWTSDFITAAGRAALGR